MHSYSSGLERLCKLAIACNGYATDGKFPNVRKYGHKIGKLLDAVEKLPLPGGAPQRQSSYLVRPSDALDPNLMNMVERFASGAGRYEHLDSLWNDDEIATYNAWAALAAKVSVPEEVRRLISLRDAVADVIESEMIELELESTAEGVLKDLELPIFEPSVGVALGLFRKVRWVSTVLGTSTDYTSQGLPILNEVVQPTFGLRSADFFSSHIAGFSDDMVIEEELGAAYERIDARETEAEGEEPRATAIIATTEAPGGSAFDAEV